MRTQRKVAAQRKGAVLPLVAALITALILVLGMMVELNWLYAKRFEAQSASDLAARSALAKAYASEDLDEDGKAEARDLGVEIYGLNFPSNPISKDELEIGLVRGDDTFDEITNEQFFHRINAAQVEYRQPFTPLLGTLMAKEDIDLPVFSRAEASRVNIVLCLDASRSMNWVVGSKEMPPGGKNISEPPLPGSRWFVLKDAVKGFLSEFSENEQSNVGLVTFGGGVAHETQISPLDLEWARTEFELDDFKTNGELINQRLVEYVTDYPMLGLGTSIYDGLEQSVGMLNSNTLIGQQYIILFTDGQQWAKGQPDQLVAGELAASAEIPVFTIALNTDPAKLEQIADMTGGQSFFANDEDELKAAFAAIATTLATRITK